MSPDRGEMWRQGLPVSVQWDGEPGLGSDGEYDDRNEAGDSDDDGGPKDSISQVSESSLWVSIRDFFLRPMF